MSKIQDQIQKHEQSIHLLKAAQMFEQAKIANTLKNDRMIHDSYKRNYDSLLEKYGQLFGSMVDEIAEREPVPDAELLDALAQYIDQQLPPDTNFIEWYHKNKENPQANKTLIKSIEKVMKITTQKTESLIDIQKIGRVERPADPFNVQAIEITLRRDVMEYGKAMINDVPVLFSYDMSADHFSLINYDDDWANGRFPEIPNKLYFLGRAISKALKSIHPLDHHPKF